MSARLPRAGDVARAVLDRGAREAMFAIASRIEHGQIDVVLPNKERRTFGVAGSESRACIEVHDKRLFSQLMLHGEIGLGEAYMDGLWSSRDLEGLLEMGARNRAALDMDAGWWRRPWRIANRQIHRARRNSIEQSRANIAAHYDLSNDLYALFLDETMAYSSAVFTGEEQSLACGQREKYRRMAMLAGIGPNSRVLEIGTGWGGFAIYAAETYGCHVTTITISEQQAVLARQRVSAAGLDNRIDVQVRDYREMGGRYDAIVSIEMIEAVGVEYFATFFERCDLLLRPGGRMALQAITLPDRSFERAVEGVNWVQKYIFPGGALPSLSAMETAMAKTRLLIRSVDDIGMDYARTLREWRQRFLTRTDDVRALGFDERFIRMWEYYLALSEAGFRTRITQDLQIGLEKV